MKIRDKIHGKTFKQRCNLKGKAVKDACVVREFNNKKIRVVIDSIKEIEGGVEVFARAYKGKKQLGFGEDGTVDIERFRILNPPTQVEDENGDIIIESVTPITNEVITRRYRKDPQQALIDTLLDTINIVAKNGKNIIQGKIGNTTTTIYSQNDGQVSSDAQATWAASQGATSGSLNTGFQQVYAYWRTVDSKYYIARSFDEFDTSSISSGDTITSATLSAKVSSVTARSGLCGVNVYQSTHSSTLAAGDYDLCGTTAFSTTVGFGSMTAGVYVDWVLDSNGIANINKGGLSRFALREANFDVANSSPAKDLNPNMIFYDSVEAGTSSDPKIVIVHSSSSPSSTSDFLMFF